MHFFTLSFVLFNDKEENLLDFCSENSKKFFLNFVASTGEVENPPRELTEQKHEN